MNIIIAGAGELGQLLAEKLSVNGHDITLVDSSEKALNGVNSLLDIKILEGNCINHDTLKQAGAATADVLLAVSGDDAVNILACQLASKLGTRKAICRVNDSFFFSEKDGITLESLGIWKFVSPPDECVRKIEAVLEDRYLVEEIRFSHPDAVMKVLEIPRFSMLAGIRIKDVSLDPELLNYVRFAAIVRGKQFLIPHGDTLLVPGDKVYIAGTSKKVRDFIKWATSDQIVPRSARVIIAGASMTGIQLACRLSDSGFDVRFVEKSRHAAEQASDQLPSNILVINGNPTEEKVLLEAGVDQCETFISTTENDEDNILSCIIAKRNGAMKTISVTSKPEYIRIVPTMDMINCGISSTLAAVNQVFRLLETGTMRVDAYLQIYHAQLTEFRVLNSSPLCGRALSVCKLPASTLFALLFRDNEVIAPSGSTVFQPGDVVVLILTPEAEKEIASLFPDR